MRASGVIFDPYKYIADEDKPSPFSADGLSLKLSTAKSVAKSSYSSAFIQRHIKDFSHRTFPAIAEEHFERFMDAYRTGDMAALRGLVTDGLLSGIRQELKQQEQSAGLNSGSAGGKARSGPKGRGAKGQRRVGGNSEASGRINAAARAPLRSAFMVDGFVRPAEVLQMRHGFAPGAVRQSTAAFGQVTCLVQSRRTVVMVDALGNTTAGEVPGGTTDAPSGDQSSRRVTLPSLLVFETGLGDSSANWRIARIEEIGSSKDRVS